MSPMAHVKKVVRRRYAIPLNRRSLKGWRNGFAVVTTPCFHDFEEVTGAELSGGERCDL